MKYKQTFHKTWEILKPFLFYYILHSAVFVLLLSLCRAAAEGLGAAYLADLTEHADTVTGIVSGLSMLISVLPFLPMLRRELAGHRAEAAVDTDDRSYRHIGSLVLSRTQCSDYFDWFGRAVCVLSGSGGPAVRRRIRDWHTLIRIGFSDHGGDCLPRAGLQPHEMLYAACSGGDCIGRAVRHLSRQSGAGGLRRLYGYPDGISV